MPPAVALARIAGSARVDSLPAIARGRPVRVICLVAACLAMSLADLAMTLTHASTIGFAEGNPIARELMGGGSVLPVVLWKLATVAVAGGIFFSLRKTRTGELGAWLACVILLWLMVRWSLYNDHVQALTTELARGSGASNVCWVHVD